MPAAIVVATVVAVVVVLVAGGPDRVGVAMILLIGVPLLIAIGGGSDHAWQATPRPAEPPSAGERCLGLVFAMPAVLGQTALLVVAGWQVLASAADGDAVCAVAVVPLAMVAAWRSRQLGRRLRAGG
ncbi:hypothetical protein GCM10020358_65000 [Amorphoplanes nipponensis]|uniref:Uncharacterized protein n=2 Tax=Actinoplanes nipponensis TaxID=135950 RepID=A0A919ML61_9ACTN|nr:hypothetical protein Ani05nite_19760 [Actinoplanes nipponensis]